MVGIWPKDDDDGNGEYIDYPCFASTIVGTLPSDLL